MVPSAFVPLETLPITPDGKMNRQARPEPDLTSVRSTKTFFPPRDRLEFQLA